MRDPGSNPKGKIMWNQDSPVSVVLLHWRPRRDWSLWPRLRQASSQTVTRLLCQQYNNPTWSHTALLSRFHSRCRSSFRLHNWHSWLLGGWPAESHLCFVGKLVCRKTIFGLAANPAHATATGMHFPANAGLIFLTDKLTNDRYLVDTGATALLPLKGFSVNKSQNITKRYINLSIKSYPLKRFYITYFNRQLLEHEPGHGHRWEHGNREWIMSMSRSMPMPMSMPCLCPCHVHVCIHLHFSDYDSLMIFLTSGILFNTSSRSLFLTQSLFASNFKFVLVC